MSVKMIAAVDFHGCIGQGNKIPWQGSYPEDFKFFKSMTLGENNPTVIMGKNTWLSMSQRPLKGRRNIVVSRTKVEVDGVETFSSLKDAIKAAENSSTWLIGGESIYRDGMGEAEEIYLTLIPEEVKGEGRVFFPWINPSMYKMMEKKPLTSDPRLEIVRYERRPS